MKYNLIQERDNTLSFMDQYLKNRGVKDIDNFFKINESCINSPFNLDYMKEGLDLLISHIKNNSKIGLLVDCDVDGFSSSAILYNYLKALAQMKLFPNFECSIHPLFHESKVHGLDDTKALETIEYTIKPNLLIIPDASGSEEQCVKLYENGIDVLILDHHDTSYKGDGNSVIVINNQHSQRYTNKDFSGAGIAWQFCRGLDETLSLNLADNYSDLAALGNIGDVMNLKADETRWIAQNGMKELHSYFLQQQKFNSYYLKDQDLTPHNVAFYIVPLFNAVCRIGTYHEKELLFKSLLDGESKNKIQYGMRGHETEQVPLATEATRIAQNAKNRQDRRKKKLFELITDLVSKQNSLEHKVLVLAYDDWDEDYRPLTGVVASALAEYYNRPVILTFKQEDYYSGSLRVPDNGNPLYKNFKDQCEESNCCIFASGHQEAAGIAFYPDKVKKLIEYFDNKYAGIQTELHYDVDFVFDAKDKDIPDMIAELAFISSIHGQGLKEPCIAIKNVKIGSDSIRLVGAKKNVLWITGPTFKLINFHSSVEEFNSLRVPGYDDPDIFYYATVICKAPSINVWGDKTTPQMQIVDYSLDRIGYIA